MATKKIEDLEQTTNLSDQDLLFISKSNGSGYDSKSVTLESIAEYVKNSIGETISDSGSETDLDVQLIDNYDSNTIDLEIMRSPTNATITYATSSSYDVSDVASWTSVSNNKATITFSPQTNMDKKYVYFKVSNNGSESKYMMQLMQSYYETTSGETSYDIRIAKIAYSGNGTSGFSGKTEAENTLLSYLPSMTGKGYTLYNAQTQDWVAPENINSSNVSQFVFNHRVNRSYYYWSYKVSVPQTSSGTYTYLHSIILPLTSIDV